MMCAPENAPVSEKIRWGWQNAYYRLTILYIALVVTLILLIQLFSRPGVC